jgi:hypothetical protein
VSTATGSSDHRQTATALAARRTSTQAALQRVDDVVARLRREKSTVTIAAIARRALLTEQDQVFQQFNG